MVNCTKEVGRHLKQITAKCYSFIWVVEHVTMIYFMFELFPNGKEIENKKESAPLGSLWFRHTFFHVFRALFTCFSVWKQATLFLLASFSCLWMSQCQILSVCHSGWQTGAKERLFDLKQQQPPSGTVNSRYRNVQVLHREGFIYWLSVHRRMCMRKSSSTWILIQSFLLSILEWVTCVLWASVTLHFKTF